MENGELASNLIRKAIKARDAREAARKARDESRNGKKNKKDKGLLSGKLTPAQSKNPAKNELYLVEGDSAGVSSRLFCLFVVRSSIQPRPRWQISSKMKKSIP